MDGRAVRVGASFGIGWASCGMTAEEVLQSADQRMYVEKRSRSEAAPAGGGLSHRRVAATAGCDAAYLTPGPLRPPHQQFTDP